jgi:hypothetical protein
MDMLFSGTAAWFGIPAVLGSIVFVIKLIMSFFSGHHGDIDDLSWDTSGHDHFPGHHDNNVMKWVSLQGIMAFLMGFGWGGLAALHGFGLSPTKSMLVGLVFGATLAGVLGFVLGAMKKLESSGNVNPADALNAEGEVYATVPAAGTGKGKVKVIVKGRQRIYTAFSEGPELSTHARIKVVKANADSSVVVAPA